MVATAVAPTSPDGGASSAEDPRPILFFDGECAFCNASVNFAMARDASARLRIAPLGGTTARAMLTPFADMLANVDSVVLFRPGAAGREASVLVHSDAALQVLRTLGGVWGIAGVLGHVVPRWIRDVAYKAFAERRIRWFGRVEACQLWPAEWRARVLP